MLDDLDVKTSEDGTKVFEFFKSFQSSESFSRTVFQ